MNGQEQKERATAVALLRVDLTKMDEDLHTLLGTTLKAALKSDDNLRAEFGTVLEDIKKELRDEFIESISAEGRARMALAHDVKMLQEHYIGFYRHSSWWVRVKWALFKGMGI